MKKILLIAYHFPPVGGLGAAGSQRMHKFAKHLPSFGWEPIVLTVEEDAYESYLKIDSTLMDGVSPELPIIRTGVLRLLAPVLNLKNRIFRRENPAESKASHTTVASPDTEDQGQRSGYQKLKDGITDLFEIPDEVSGWLLPAIYKGYRTIRKQEIDVILATGRPWSSLVIGAALRRLTGRPLVVDFRDPWMTNPFRIRYSSLKNMLERKLEAWVVRTSDVIVANTEQLRLEFVDRFGQSAAAKSVTVINGFDAKEFDSIKPEVRSEELRDAFLLLHSGFLYGKRDPKTLIDAIGLLHERNELTSVKFCCELIGSVELPYDLGDYIREQGLSEYVQLRGEVSYAESISAVAACDSTILLQPGTITQIPSKVFEYIGLSKRILTIAPLNSSVSKLVADNELGSLADPDDVEGVAEAILGEIRAWSSKGRESSISPAVRKRFDVSNTVRLLCQKIDDLPIPSASGE